VKFTREIKVGLFMAGGLLLFFTGFNFLKGFHPFRSYTSYHVVYADVSGIVNSSQVLVNGLKIGQVENITTLQPGDARQLVVTFTINKSIKIPMGSVIRISGTDLLGNKALVLFPSAATTYHNYGDTLKGEVEESLSSTISAMVSPLKEKSEQVLITLDKVLQSMNDVFDSAGTRRIASSINDISWSIHNMRNITQRMDKLTESEYGRLEAMMQNLESITRNLKSNNEHIARSMKNLARITDSVAASDLTATINNTKRVMDEFATALNKVNNGEGSLGMLANDTTLYVNLAQTSKELELLMKDMQAYPARYFTVSVFGGGKRAKKQDKERSSKSAAKP
jgi:phospholipid/cholesterol/gamma-HCH transport system substrate-binding protein